MVCCKPSEHEMALTKINEIKQLIAENHKQDALNKIDSIHIIYKKDIAIRRIADTLRWEIELEQSIERLPLIDSALANVQARLPEITKAFRYIKNEDYQDIGHFEHRQLRTENNTTRCYLKPSISEQGAMTITSYYLGTKASHTTVRVTIDSLSVETQVAPKSNISQFIDVDMYREIIVFDSKLMNGIDSFIAKNKDNRIKISLIGNGQPYHYYLTPTERNILTQSYDLSIALSDFTRLTNEQLKLSQKIELLKQRLNQ